MTTRGRRRGANALLHTICSTSGHHFPKIYVVGDSPFFFHTAAVRHQQWLELVNSVMPVMSRVNTEIETITFDEAWKIIHGNLEPCGSEALVDYTISQIGN